jgi:hypothetical protein
MRQRRKPLRHDWSDYHKSKNGSIWIPAELLEIKPYQRMNAQLCPSLTASMIEVALREPAPHAQLLVEEVLDVLGVQTGTGQQASGAQPIAHINVVSLRKARLMGATDNYIAKHVGLPPR